MFTELVKSAVGPPPVLAVVVPPLAELLLLRDPPENAPPPDELPPNAPLEPPKLLPLLPLLPPPKPLEPNPLLPPLLLPIPNELPFMLPSELPRPSEFLPVDGERVLGPLPPPSRPFERLHHFRSGRILEVIDVDARILIRRPNIELIDELLDLAHLKLARQDDQGVGPFIGDDAESRGGALRLRSEARPIAPPP